MYMLRIFPLAFALLLIFHRQCCPVQEEFTPYLQGFKCESQPTWFNHAFLTASILESQNHVLSHFVRSRYSMKRGSWSAFGINWSLAIVGSRHASFMRLLLLVSGDVESNPGPTKPTPNSSITDEISNSETSSNGVQLNHTCAACSKGFRRAEHLKRHEESMHVGTSSSRQKESGQGTTSTISEEFKCSTCGKTFTSQSNLTRHTENPNVHVKKTPTKFSCTLCGKNFPREQNLIRHQKMHDRKRLPDKPSASEPQPPTKRQKTPDALSPEANLNHIDQTGWERLQPQKRAFRGNMASYRVEPSNDSTRDPQMFLQDMEKDITTAVLAYLDQITGIKLQLSIRMKFYKPTNPNETCEGYFWSLPVPILRGDDIQESVRSCLPKIIQAHDTFIQKGSGWVDHHILNMDVHFSRYQPLKAGCCVELPKKLRDKKGILNIQNDDDKCFLWCMIAADHLEEVDTDVRKRVTSYVAYEKDYDLTGVRFPVSFHQVKKFEKQNEVSINVFGYEPNDVLPLQISKLRFEKHVNLFLFKGHYFLITNLDRFLSDQRKGNRKNYFCHRCLFPCGSEDKRNEHLGYCSNEDPSITRKPHETKLLFTNTQRMLRRTVVVYFECLTEKIDHSTSVGDGAKPNKEPYQRHVPCGYGLVESHNCCGNAEMRPARKHRGVDCVERFLTDVVGIGTSLQEDLDNTKELQLDFNQQKRFDECTECYLCQKFIEDESTKVRDHCHMCGNYRGAAHTECNLNYRLDRDITVVFHNLRRNDGHRIMQQIGGACKQFGMKLDCIAKSMEDYLSFSLTMPSDKEEGTKLWRIRFIDSYQFLSTSLDNLAKALPKDKFKALNEMYQNDKEFNLLARKGVYPYDYMDKWERFAETNLPDKEKFYNLLTESNISEDDYEHAQNVWKEFRLKNMGEYHDLYLLTDVLILHDVFEEFRSLAVENYGLDPTHYITLPSMAWDACLKITKVELELLQDPTMYAFFEKGIRGGISVVSGRYAKANNEHCEDYDQEKPNSYIMYNDANNLYGWAMPQRLPTNGFRWLTDNQIEMLTVGDFKPNQSKGYILEVDLDYPAELHDAHNDYPLAPEKIEITDAMLSPFCTQLKEDLNVKNPEMMKLVPNLMDKKHYVIHSWQLHLCIEEGLQLKKIHKAMEFSQSTWMEPYIILNTELRKKATTDFEKSMFKLMNNAVFGKTMENTRLYKEIKLATTEQHAIKLIKSPRFKQGVVFNENLAGLAMAKKFTKLNKPIYVGFSVLEISKILMYEFHYKHIVPKYGEKAKLLFTDTDSLMYHITTDDIYADIGLDLDIYDTSDYPKEHFLHSPMNKKVLGKMKDETNGKPISHFVGLKSKMYSFLCDGEEKKRAKGIKKSTVDKHVSFTQYLDSAFKYTKYKHDMKLIRSELHQLYSLNLTKTSLTPFDDKRYILEDGINSLAYGHYKIQSAKPATISGVTFEEIDAEPMDYQPTSGCNIKIEVADD